MTSFNQNAVEQTTTSYFFTSDRVYCQRKGKLPLQLAVNCHRLMAPIRRYLRISKYSVLECRIYLHNPADSRWLLDPQDNVLSRVFERIRPHVLPKLREENERMRAKKKSSPLKDVITEG